MMRIQQLDLAFFGHFTDRQFDFGNVPHAETDFHLIYGPNEAGKTTFMEGYLRLLYGFLPKNEPYAFKHGRKNLQVSATLAIDGEPRTFQRQPTRQKSLLDANGNALPEAALQAHLGGLSMDDYRKLLCIDDERIEEGGEEIIASKGDIGTLLFSAAAGISDLSQVLESVRSQADDLYRKSASKTRLAELKKAHATLERQIRDLDVPATRLQQLTTALVAAKDSERQAREECSGLSDEQKRLDKQLRALPQLGELDELVQASAALAHYPATLKVTSKEIMDLLSDERLVDTDIARLDDEHARLTSELDQLPLEPAHLQLQGVLANLDELHSRHATAEMDLDTTLEKLNATVAGMASMVRDRLHADLDPVALLVDTSVIDTLTTLLAQRNELVEQLDKEQKTQDSLQTSITDEACTLKALQESSPEGDGIAELLTRYDSQTLLVQASTADAAIATAEQAFASSLDALTIKGHSFSTLPTCTMSNEEAAEWVEQWQKLDTMHETTRPTLKADQRTLSALVTERKELEAVEGLVSEDQARLLRGAREQAWQDHLATMTAVTAEVFETAMHSLDQVMDGRLANASTLARLRELYRQSADVEARVTLTQDELLLTGQKRQHAEQVLADVMQGAGISDAMTPRAIQAWVRKCHETVQAERGCQRVRKQHQATVDKAQKLMHALSEFIPREQPSLEELVKAAGTMSSDYESHARSIQASRQKLAQLEGEQTTAQAALAECEAALANAQQDWEQCVQNSFSVPVDALKLESELSLLTLLRESNVQRETLLQSVTSMQRDQQLFSQKLTDVIDNYRLKDEGTSSANHHRLQTLSNHAIELSKQKLALEASLVKKAEARELAGKKMATLRSKADTIAGLFDKRIPTSGLGQLLDAVERTHEALALRVKHTELRRSLLDTLGVTTLEQVRQLLAGLDPTALQERLDSTEAELDAARQRHTVAIETRAGSEHQLASITGDGQVAQLVEQRTTIELEMSEAALTYLKLSLGHQLAERAIKRYRDRHRSTMLEATEDDFARLTNGHYTSLQTKTDGRTEALLALDKSGIPKRADQMSKGTRFQLYLALRAAAYDQLSDQGTCLPFICDDIFETFDEDRTRAACVMMERIGQRGQAIYLTHHRHVVELAREVCQSRVRVHSL